MASQPARYSRRSVLSGMGAVGLSALGMGAVAGCSDGPRRTAREFLAGDRYFIAHRGSADEAPEHTLAAYSYAVDRGAQAVEISVHRTRDGVFVCHHDADLARTCNGLAGEIKDMDLVQLADVRVDMSHYVGPQWGAQPLPRLDDVLDRIGGRTVLFVEPKEPTAAADLVALIRARGLVETTVFKQHYSHRGDELARQAGVAVWNYYDNEASSADIAALGTRSDAIGADANNDPLDPERIELVKAAVSTGKPVIAWAVHRRHQVDRLAALGVRGFMASAWSYLAQQPAAERRDGFGTGRVRPGDLPSAQDPRLVTAWNTDNSIGLTDAEATESLSMGSMCPLPASYSLDLEMRFDSVPAEKSQHAGVVIGRDDDAPYRFGILEPSGGQLVILRGNGSLELRQIPLDNDSSVLLAATEGEPVGAGRWEALKIRVGRNGIEVTRTPTDGRPRVVRASVASTGRNFALTRNYAGDGAAVRFRNLHVAELST